MIILYIFLATIVGFFVLQTIVARTEKRMVWPYTQPEAHPQYPDLGGYRARFVNGALEGHCTFLGWVADAKGPRYQLTYGLLATPERDCLVVVGAGKLASFSVRTTWLHTRDVEGRIFTTTDHLAGAELDITRMNRTQLAPAGSFASLLEQHRKALAKRQVQVKLYTPGHELGEFWQCREQRFRVMEERGLVAFIEPERTYFQYTLRGALKVAGWSAVVSTLRGVTFSTFPRTI